MLTNPRSDRVKSVASLARRSTRTRTGRILIEGPQGVREAVRLAPDDVVDLYTTPAAADRYESIITAAREKGVYVHEASDEVLAAMCDATTPQGLVAVSTWAPATFEEIITDRPRLLVFLTHVRDPGNLGTVIRAADAAGADAVLISDESVDVTSPKVVRSTAGSIHHLPIATGLPVLETIGRLRDEGIRTWAADGSGSVLVDDADLDGAHAWVMGNEAWGLTPETLHACDGAVRVPIYGLAESLNLAMASTVCLYTSARVQRSSATAKG